MKEKVSFSMLIVFASILIIGLFISCVYQSKQKAKLQQEVSLLKPMVKTVNNIRDILYYCETVPKLNYLYLSPTVDDLLGPGTLEEHLQNPDKIFDIVHPDDMGILKKKELGQLDFNEPIKVRFRNHEGKYIWFEEYARPVYKDGKFVAVTGIYRNIDDMVALQEQLEYKSTHDALTNVRNREYFESKMSFFNQCKIPMGIVIADLDELKQINDNYGHQMGDRLIREAANGLNTHAEAGMIVARIGGDEFAVLIPNATVLQIKQYVEKVQDEMQQRVGLTHSPIQISIGYEYANNSFGVMEQLMSVADENMYQNKNSKKQLLTVEG